MPPPWEDAEEPGVKGPPREEGGVSRRGSLKPVSTEQGVVLPGVRGGILEPMKSTESLRRTSEDCGVEEHGMSDVRKTEKAVRYLLHAIL